MKLGRITQLAFFALLALVTVTAHAQKPQQKKELRPFWGSVLGEVTWGNPGVCPDQPVQTLSNANGNTLLGNTTFAGSHCASSDGSRALGGVAVFTAANGDQIHVTYTSKTVTPPPPLIVQQGEMIIVGGRFCSFSRGLSVTDRISFQSVCLVSDGNCSLVPRFGALRWTLTWVRSSDLA